MTELYSEKKRSAINRAAEAGLLFVIGLYILAIDLSKTTLKLDIKIENLFFVIALAVLAVVRLALLYTGQKEDRKGLVKTVLCALAISAVYMGVWLANPADALLVLALLTISTIGMDHRKILKVYIAAAAAVIFTAIALSWIGAIENFVYIRDMTIRSSWGIKYPTDMMSLLFFLLLAVWVAYGGKSSLRYLIAGGVLMLMSYFVADSRTGVLCGALFIVAVLTWHLLSKKEDGRLARTAEFCMCALFPVLTLVMNALVFAYRHGFTWASKINEILSNRLYHSVQALNEYGLSLWGKPLEQVGWGGTVFARPEYDFVDISYVLLLLRYGIAALIVINVLWVLMTRHAFRVGDRRLAIALSLIAVNCAIEHHIVQINYNIFIAIPFAVMASKGVEETAEHGEQTTDIRDVAIKIATAAGLTAAISFGVLALLPKARTFISLINMDNRTSGRRLLFIAVAAGLFLAAKAICCAYDLILGLINRDRTSLKKNAAATAALAVVVCMAIFVSNMVISRGAVKKDDTLESERSVIELVQANKSGKFYVKGMPVLYQKKFGGVSSSLFNGEELARYRNTSVIMQKKLDSPCFFNTGFLYLRVSEKHALYTNDEPVIRALQKAGYHLTAYYPVGTDAKMKKLARLNGLDQNEDGFITLHGWTETLHKGPRADLRAGRYTITYDLAIESSAGDPEEEICRLVTTFYKGEYELSDVTISRDKFDKNGECLTEVVVDMPDAENTDFCVYPVGQNNVTVKGISWQKTPKVDTHSIYNEDRIKVREEYYDLDGKPYDLIAGYFARDLGYDDGGNIDHEIYYDKDNNRTLSSAGYAEVKRTFDGLHHVLREEFYGTDGKRVALPQGQSAAKYKYNEKGYQTEARYYGVNDEPILAGGETWGGYHGLTREFDDSGRITREDFFGTDGEPVVLKEGYASREYEFDAEGNRISESYFDADNKPVSCTNGYSSIKKQYDEFGRVIREEYYGTDGKRITLPPGQAAVEYVYDEEGHQRELLYYDINDMPVMVGDEGWGGYQRIVRDFDDQGRVIKDMFCDKEGKPVVLKEGYTYREYEYDEKGNMVKETHFDISGNVV